MEELTTDCSPAPTYSSLEDITSEINANMLSLWYLYALVTIAVHLDLLRLWQQEYRNITKTRRGQNYYIAQNQ